jgi:hypothetical protein
MGASSSRRWPAGFRLHLLCVFAAALLMACGAPRRVAPEDELAEGALGAECKGASVQCEANKFRTCLNGRWRDKRACLTSQVCDASVGGCVDCSPSLPTQCDGDDVRKCDASGHFGEVVLTCDPGMCKGGNCLNSCGVDADLIYIVDQQYRLLSFNPRDGKNDIKLIGSLSCPAGPAWGGGTSTPFSMSVDRDAQAWVLYNSGEIFWVNTKDAMCKPSGFLPGQNGFQTFGMGFVSDSVGTSNETLFITGGSYATPGKGNLGSVHKMALNVTTRGALPDTEYGPELTGTGKAELYGYFPGDNSFVARFDKATGMPAVTWPLPPVTETVQAWAFAHWGGRFYIFITTLDSGTFMPNSQILMFTPVDGKVTPLLDHLPYTIVGAGVSTCAPIIIG